MKQIPLEEFREGAQGLKEGDIGVIPTDTIYGVVASVYSETAVERLYVLRKRDKEKPCIVLIHDISLLADFGIIPDALLSQCLSSVWPGPVSVILPGVDKRFSYLHRGTKSLAFRVPKDTWLKNLLLQSGPLLAPSANREGEPPAQSINEAKDYFGDTVDFYIDGGVLKRKSSTVAKYTGGKLVILRSGTPL